MNTLIGYGIGTHNKHIANITVYWLHPKNRDKVETDSKLTKKLPFNVSAAFTRLKVHTSNMDEEPKQVNTARPGCSGEKKTHISQGEGQTEVTGRELSAVTWNGTSSCG